MTSEQEKIEERVQPPCALCGKVAPLQRSHILPRFTLRRMKKTENRFLKFSARGHPNGRWINDAFFEKLLCWECEQHFQMWEKYAARLMNGKQVFDFANPGPGKMQVLRGLSYAPLKLFLLSLLWRMGASRLEDFEKVQLGPHLEAIGKMLLSSDPGPSWKYGALLMVVHVEGARAPIGRPADLIPDFELTTYRCVLDGLMITWVVGSDEAMQAFSGRRAFLDETGTWLALARDFTEIETLMHDFAHHFGRQEEWLDKNART